MKHFLLIASIGLVNLGHLSTFATTTIWNLSDNSHSPIVVVTQNYPNGTGSPYFQTNSISYGAGVAFGTLVDTVYLHSLNGLYPAFQPSVVTSDKHIFSQAGPYVVEYVCYGQSWNVPYIPSGSSEVQILSVVSSPQAGAIMASSTACGGPCAGAQPMASYRFHTLLTSLSVFDTPIAYSTPRGPNVQVQVVYNQKDSSPTNRPYSNLGDKWLLSSVAFIQDNTTDPAADVRCYPQGGGYEVFSGFDTNSGKFNTGIYSQTRLTRTGPNSYVRAFSDGTVEVYAHTDGASTNRRVFLTKSYDVASNAVSYVYQPVTGGTRLIHIIDSLNQTNTIAYENGADPLKITSITDPFGRTAYFGYTFTNGGLRLTSITDPVQIVSQFGYETNGFLNTLTTPYGTTRFTYTENTTTKTLTATDPKGATECLQYWAVNSTPMLEPYPSGVLLDANSLGERNSFYWNKRAWALYPNDISKAEVTHWALRNDEVVDIPLAIKKPLESPTWFNYPSQTSPLGTNISLAQPSRIARVLDDGTTQTLQAAYDGWGNLTNAVDASGRSTSFVYSTNGIDLLSISQKNGTASDVIASFFYNIWHQPTLAVTQGITNRFGYNSAGQLLKTTNALNQVTTYVYDIRGYLTNIVGHTADDTLDVRYDNAGRIFAVTDSRGYSVTNTYDSIDRITNVVFPDATSIQMIYDRLSLGHVKGRDNRWTHYTSEANGRLSTIQDAAGRQFHFDWCGCGALESITDPKNQLTAWLRDAQNRPTQKLYSDMSSETTEYEDRSSRLKHTIDPAGKKTTISYNKDDTVQQISYSGGPATATINFSYDPYYNRLTQMADGIGTNTLTYVPAGQPGAGGIQTIDGPLPSDTITLGYDALGRPLTLQVGSATSAVQYDSLGRVWWSSNMLGVTTVQYVAATGQPDKITRPNGTATVFGYTPVADGSRLRSMVTTNGSGQIVESYGYAYDVRNLITWQTNVIGGVTSVWNYAYDIAQQLTDATQWTNGVLAHRYSYSYDLAGNRLSEQIDASAATENPNSLNQLISRTGGGTVKIAGYLNETGTVTVAGAPARMTSATNFEGEVTVGVGSYNIPVTGTDLNNNSTTNNVVRTFTANGLSTSLTYDKAGNLLVKSNASQVLTFGWDGADRCTAITNGNLRTALAYDGLNRWSRITEYSNSTATADRRFVYNGTGLAEERDSTCNIVIKRFFANGFWQQGTNYYYQKDHLGSVTAVTLQNGTVVARFQYDPYGRRTQTFGTMWVDFGFAGLFEHGPTELQFAVFRLKSLERWLTRDPIGEIGGWNLYAYCGGNPVNLTDILGYVPDLNLFNTDKSIFSSAERRPSKANVFLITAHGNSQNIFDDRGTASKKLTVNALIQLIKASPFWKPGMTVRLEACNSGSGANSFAQQLADTLNTIVEAPSFGIWFAEPGPWGIQGPLSGFSVPTELRNVNPFGTDQLTTFKPTQKR